MPADETYDKPHDLTKRTHADKYTCSGPREVRYYGTRRVYRPNGTWYLEMQKINDVMSIPCNYDKWQTDPRCVENCPRKEVK